ncbi:sensor histidine kinase [Pseudogracilibacillus auburnensis]|uniref:histidine kinase n=1 Tax=Pseudogracilibacillus auburnensis TaxID=1494959 RepID=A0A2V3WAE3_9BACI|nr:sensor histidine kinase [Pseudogracilibacillus auburnensis]PXW90114.1 sensor histidine kinase YesM [Pseudogracilibacillus auburnensis]
MTLRNKIFIIYTILIIVPLLAISFAVHYIFSTSKIHDTTVNTENSIKQFNNSLDLIVEDAARSTLSLLYNRELIDILKEYDENTFITYKNHQHTTAFSLFLSGILYDKKQIHGIHVFANNGQIFSHMNNYSLTNRIYLPNEEWYVTAKEKRGSWIIHPEELPVYYSRNNQKMISIVRLLRDPEDKKEIGVMKVDFSPEYITQLTDQLISDDWKIASDGMQLIKKKNSRLLEKCTTNQSWITDEETNEDYLCITNTSSKTNIQVSNVIPKQYIYKEIIEFDRLLFILIFIFLIVSLMLSFYTSNHLLKPLEMLKNQIKGMQNNPYNEIQLKYEGEVAILSGAYNNLLAEIKDLVEEIYELNTRNAESEYKALQSRMDPHFIFNTLESINMTAVKRRQFDISDMITELGKLIRYRLKNDEQLVSLQDELAFCFTYLSIMKQRMMENLMIHQEIDERILQKKVPKYMIQPLIENALIHGKDDHTLKIMIKVKRKKDFIRISVEDNGVGISPEKLQCIDKRMNDKAKVAYSSSNKGAGIALENIYKRLKLIYGEKASLIIDSNLHEGTKMTIIIPTNKGDFID